MTNADRTIEILLPSHDGDDSPAAVTRRMAKAAVASAADALAAAHRQALASLDEVMDEALLASCADMSAEGASEFMAATDEMRTRAKEQMTARSLMLADAFQRAAIVDIANADAAVRQIHASVAHVRKGPASGD